jgi:hypothetical protein
LIGKAEASSAGEQLARNNLSDWNGQRSERNVLTFFCFIPRVYAYKKLIPHLRGCYKKQPSINSASSLHFSIQFFYNG